MQQKERHKRNLGKKVINCNNDAYRENHTVTIPRIRSFSVSFLRFFKKTYFMFVQLIKLGGIIFR